jgi:hypothetical protein
MGSATLMSERRYGLMRQMASRELMALHQRFEQWRRDRSSRADRIPVQLWDEAAQVARIDGVYATSRVLRLDYNQLKERARVGGGDATPAPPEELGPSFVEVGVGQLVNGGGTVVEFVGRSGDRMRIEVTGARTVDLVGLTEAFWRDRP